MYLKGKIARIILIPAIISLSIFLWMEYPKFCSWLLVISAVIMSAGYIKEEFLTSNKSDDKRN